MDEQRKPERALVPALRFEGFNDPWEQRRLGECGTTYGGLSGKTKEDFGHGEARFVPYTNVFENPIADTSRLEPVEIDPKQNQVRLGDVFFTVSSETPEDVGMSSVWLSDQPNVYLNSFCFGYRQDESFDSDYLAYMLRSQGVRYDIALLAQGISRFNISKNKVMELDVPFPEKGEQELIGTFFQKLDSLIALHQCKHDKLKTVKQSLLEKMFPKEGKDVPEIRFEGFTEPWEQRKLGEVVRNLSTGKSVNSLDEQGSEGEICVLKTSCVSANSFDPTERKQVVESERDLARCPVEKGTLVVSRMNTPDLVGSCGYCAADMGNLFLPDRLWKVSFEDSASPYFIYTVLASFACQERLKAAATGTSGSMKNVSQSSLLDLDLSVPLLEEQQRVGVFFAKLDSLIALHQRELEILKNLKKAMLEKMFV